MNKALLLVVAASMTVTAGCQQAQNIRNQDVGAVVGGVAGGVLGTQVGKGKGRTAAIIAGTLLGAYIGGSIGQRMDDADRYEANRSLETMPTGSAHAWTNPANGTQYSVKPVRTYQNTAQAPCREYEMEAWIDGRKETIVGTACRDEQGR